MPKSIEIMADESIPFDIRYKRVYKLIDTAARQTIGRTTIKGKKKEKISQEQNELILKKKSLKKEIQAETDKTEKDKLIEEYEIKS